MSAQDLARIARGAPAPEGTQVVRGTPPPWLDGAGTRAVLTPFMAAFMVSAAILRDRVATAPLDLLGLCLRTLAFAFTVRALLDVVRTARTLLVQRAASAHALVWDDAGLLHVSPEGETYVARSDVADVAMAPLRVAGSPRRRAREVWLCLWPRAGRTHVTLPPYFARDGEVLHARLRRWLGTTTPPSDAEEPAPEVLPQTGAGGVPPGASSVRSAPDYVSRAPLSWLLVAVLCLDVLRVAPAELRAPLAMPLLAAAALCVAAPVAWWLWLRRRLPARGALSLVLTPALAIGFDRHGSVALAWDALQQAEVQYRGGWSPWSGGYAVRTLDLRGQDGTQLRFDGSLIDTPVEVLAALTEALSERRSSDDD